MTTINLTERALRAHAINRKNGFWDPEPPVNRSIVLMLGELFEAVEAERRGLWFNKNIAHSDLKEVFTNLPFHAKQFEKIIKDTVEDELADTVIRGLDILIGHFESIGIETNITETPEMPLYEFVYESLVSQPDQYDVCELISDIFSFSSRHGIDLLWHIDMKLKYNETREYKHGKAY